MYLNTIPYGGTLYGVKAAAGAYFGKTAKDLSPQRPHISRR